MVTRSGAGGALTPRLLTPGVTQMRPKATTPSGVLRTCESCGREFRARPWNIKQGGGRYCSRSCGQVRRPAVPIISPDGLAASIPLVGIDGSVRAYVVIDVADVEWASQWRWYLGAEGYAERVPGRDANGKRPHVLLHRDLLGLKRGDGLEVDHIDRDRLNCRRLNMRVLPEGKNMQNLPGYGVHSQHRGVTYMVRQRKWHARVRVDGKMRHLGSFETEDEAAEAARAARARFMPYAVD